MRLLLFAALLLAGCAADGRDTTSAPVPRTLTDFRPGEIRQPAVVIALSSALDARAGTALTAEYEGALLEGLNARGIIVRHAGRASEVGRDVRAGVAHARAVEADSVILVRVEVRPATVVFCRESGRPVSLGVTVWRQRVEIARASDAAVRLRTEDDGLDVTDADVDCEDPRRPRRRAPAETATLAAERLLTEIFGR
jgi:hypothetical protein